MKEEIIKIIKEALSKNNINYKDNIIVEIPTNKINGDFSTNIAMKLASSLKKSPMEIANSLIKDITGDKIQDVKVASPGFINIYLNSEAILSVINYILNKKENFGKNEMGKDKKINIEFVSANPTGIMHIGNARGGAYGDNLSRILSWCGYSVNKEYYVNDLGNQVKNLGLSLQARYKQALGIKTDMPENGYFGKDIIAMGENLAKEYKDTKVTEDLEFFKTYGIEKLLEKIKQDLCEYRVVHDEFTSEKSVYDTGEIKKVLDYLRKNDYIYDIDGATWFKATKLNAPRDFVVIKSNKDYTYLLPDLAHYKLNMAKKYDKMINVLGADHHGYVPGLKTGCEAIGIEKDKVEIKLLQLVKLIEDGIEIKMSKRSGKVFTLKDLIDEVGVNAARYYFAAKSLDTPMDFDIDLAKKKSNENPVYYVCYAYARICTILNENKIDKYVDKYETIHENEAYSILEKLSQFEDIVKESALKEMPHIITNYVYDLATLFHSYYSKYRILSEDENKTIESLNFIKAIKITLENALYLIGVIPPTKM